MRVAGRPCGINSSVMIWHAPPVTASLHSSNTGHFNDSDSVSESEHKFRGSSIHTLYTTIRDHHDMILRAMYKFDHYLEFMFATSISTEDGDIYSLQENVLFLQDRYPGLFIDYEEAENISQSLVSEKSCDWSFTAAGVICFPLHPKPHHIQDKEWVKKYWDTSAPVDVLPSPQTLPQHTPTPPYHHRDPIVCDDVQDSSAGSGGSSSGSSVVGISHSLMEEEVD